MSDKRIYFIRPIGASGPVKIGCSWYPDDRLKSLITWSPVPLEIAVTIPGDFDLERNIQNCFADLHTHREWFRADPRLSAVIDKLISGVAINDAIDLSAVRGDVKAEHYRKRSQAIAARKSLSPIPSNEVEVS